MLKITPSFPCNPPLILSKQAGYCKPPCDWLSFSEKEQQGMSIADWIAVVFSTTCFCLVFTTWLKLPEFMKFPHLLILLMAGMSAFIGILVIIPKLRERSKLFCSSEFLDDAIKTPTTFCEAQGALIQYVSFVIGELFVIYNAVLLKRLVIDKRPNESHSRTFLVVLSLVVIALPIIPVVYVLKFGSNYTVVNLRYCFQKNADEGFYSSLLPQQLFISVGITCMMLVIFKLIKERKSSLIGSPNQARRRQLQMQKIASQFIMVIISYIVCVFLTYGLLCIQLSNREAYEMSLKKYFGCLFFSNNCPRDFLEYETSYGLVIVFLLSGIVFQAGTLILLIGKQKVRRLWQSWWFSLVGMCRRPSRKLPSTTSSIELQPSTSDSSQKKI
ncbi:uncharacterized protein LOC114519795 isoform X2 [Dendronephthya gigantea]|nr:uncharacterized protein LOC114519795 isoform X2 [Dendronephthya gigantea]